MGSVDLYILQQSIPNFNSVKEQEIQLQICDWTKEHTDIQANRQMARIISKKNLTILESVKMNKYQSIYLLLHIVT